MTEFIDRSWSAILRTGAVYCSIIAILIAAGSLRSTAPVWPLSLYTAIWILALAFPVTAALYIMFDLRVRLNQVEDSAQRNGVFTIYFPGSAIADREFRHLLNLKFRQSCNPWELNCFGLAAGIVAFMVQYFPLSEAGLNPHAEDISKLSISNWPVLAGFFGAFAGALVLILRKHRTLDIYPTTYFQASIALILGPLVGGFISSGFTPSAKMAGVDYAVLRNSIAFALGFVTATNVNFLGNLLRHRVSKWTGIPLPPPKGGDLDLLIQNSEAIESLNNLSCFSVAEFVTMEPIILYLNMPQPINCLDEWLDEALLAHYFRPHLKALAAVDIKRFTQLLEYVIEKWPDTGVIQAIEWKRPFQITGDHAVDQVIGAAAAALVMSEIHDRLLGILSQKYRRAFYPVVRNAESAIYQIQRNLSRVPPQGRPDSTPASESPRAA